MATQTYAQLREQIAALERQAAKAKDEETAGVMARIRVAIDAYGITPQDLFGRKSGVVKGAYKGKAPAPAKFIDGKGGQWVGRGKRPKWLSDALAAGKHLEDFLAENFDSAVEAFSAPATVGVPFGEKSVSKRTAIKAETKVKTTKPARAGK